MQVHFKFRECRKYLKHSTKHKKKVLAAALQMMITSSVHSSSGSPALENLLLYGSDDAGIHRYLGTSLVAKPLTFSAFSY